MSAIQRTGKLRAYLEFVAAVLYFFIVRAFARNAAIAVQRDAWQPLVEQTLFAGLLILGYAAFGALFDRQPRSIAAQGLPLRSGWAGEFGIGAAIGWGAVVVCVLPMLLVGGIAVVITTQHGAWGWLVADAAYFLLLALGEEVAFRGYGFQRFAVVVGPSGAAFGYALFYAIMRAVQPGSTNASIAISVVFSFLLTTAYLRTRALWVSWGLNFAWKASQALIFGLTVTGVSSHSPVIEGNPMGPFWLTGGGYGLDASWWACVVLLVAFAVLYRATRELDFKHNAPVFVGAGIPVDIDAAAKRQHEAAMGHAEPAAPGLVQILPAATPPAETRAASEPALERAADREDLP
ncbi:CPBP family intramembrane glutamic endopeptidase [Occallatibacter savannae]|uniref:CPBP family intramembrane glutamic endopeptidase n=1 Tax=Occallatibacter savannae TaxID=1002691 RepID=UPI000D688FBB|nr:type II CAAX endopeptidase family protein [Occallatibacter savannae]